MIAADSQSVFNMLAGIDAAVWNALVDAYTRCGEFTEAMNTFNKMLSAKVPPSSVTFLSLLSACCHTGLVDKGVELFESMCSDRRLNLDIRHYGCLLDLLGRAGNFERLERWLLRMPVQADMAAYLGLLGACRVYGNMHLGKHLFDHLS
jgi:pentatricopeptide repeat protein